MGARATVCGILLEGSASLTRGLLWHHLGNSKSCSDLWVYLAIAINLAQVAVSLPHSNNQWLWLTVDCSTATCTYFGSPVWHIGTTLSYATVDQNYGLVNLMCTWRSLYILSKVYRKGSLKLNAYNSNILCYNFTSHCIFCSGPLLFRHFQLFVRTLHKAVCTRLQSVLTFLSQTQGRVIHNAQYMTYRSWLWLCQTTLVCSVKPASLTRAPPKPRNHAREYHFRFDIKL